MAARPSKSIRISFVEKLLFTKHLAVMIKSGIPIDEALSTLIDQSSSRQFLSVLRSVRADVDNGQSLASAFSKFPNIFDQFYISLIQVGEKSGTLEQNLEFLGVQLGKQYTLRQKIQGAMLYPALIFFATVVMGGFIALFILPQLVGFFDAFEIELPVTTKILLFVANIMKDYGIFIVGGIAGIIILWIAFTRTSFGKPIWHRIQLTLPLFGTLIRYSQLSGFSRNLGVLLQSGVPVTQSLEITAGTLSNCIYEQELMEVSRSLSKGKNIGDILKLKGFEEFPPLVAKMIGVGEKTGKLEDVLLYLGDFYEDEIDSISKNLTTLLEPFLLLAIGLVVGFVALAIISPIYELTGSIRQ